MKLYADAVCEVRTLATISVIVGDYSKTELLSLIPGLTKWRIDEARKHAFVARPAQVIEPPGSQKCRLDPVMVDHVQDFSFRI